MPESSVLQNLSLAELARRNAGIGASQEEQTDSPYTSYPSASPVVGNGVDVSGALWCEVIVRPVGGDAVFTVFGRSLDDTVFDSISQGTPITATTKGYKELMRCPTLAEVFVQIDSATATSVEVFISPCGG